MIFEELPLKGAYRIVLQRHEDDRGFFARTWCRQTFAEQGLKDCSEQCSISSNLAAGTLRGMHFQRSPHAETKLVRCSRGVVFDCIVDLRKGSGTFGDTHGEVLSAQNALAFYIPQGFAHGFLTLEDDTEVDYQMAEAFVPGFAAGFVWDDPDIAIAWPRLPAVINDRDRALPRFADLESAYPGHV